MKTHRIALALAVAAALASQSARAFYNDRIEVFADDAMTWDSNVFRLSKNVNPETNIGAASLSDRFNVLTLGATLDVPYSLQRFQAGYSWFATRYNRFKQLDFNGHNARANWLWAVTPEITGDAGIADSQSLANFAVFSGPQKDLVTARQAYVNGTWAPTPSYLLFAGASRDERKHDDPARRVNDVTADAAELRLSYVTAAENRLGVSFRRETGQAPDQLLGDVPFNNGYTQNSLGVVGRWTLSGHTRLDGRADYVRRNYDQFPERDYKGPSFRLTHTWTPTGKLTFVTIGYREIAPLDEIQTAFVLTKGVTFRPRWDVSSKIAVQGTFDYSHWQYSSVLPVAAPGFIVPSGPFSTRVRSGGVSVDWRPLARVLLRAGYLRETRTSSIVTGDYDANVATLEARIGF